MLLDQANIDGAVRGLLTKVSDVYAFIMEEEELAKVESNLAIYGKIAKQTLECADFIVHYSETKSACESIPLLRLLTLNLYLCTGIRLGKHSCDGTGTTIQSYSNVLDTLMQQFRDREAHDTVLTVYHMGRVGFKFTLNLR
jgi:hypothetical protein